MSVVIDQGENTEGFVYLVEPKFHYMHVHSKQNPGMASDNKSL